MDTAAASFFTAFGNQALAQINEAIRQASARLKTRGFQVRTVTATDHPKFALRQKTCIRLQR